MVTRVEDKDNTMNELNQDSVAGENELEKDNIDSEVIDDTMEDSDDEILEEVEETSEGEVKKSFFKKDKKEKKDKKDLKIEELNDRLIRTMAEFDNFRKRSEKEKSQMFEIGARDIIEKVLPVIDNFERGLGTITEEEKENAFAQGIEKIYKQLVTSLTEAGLKTIDAVGQEFNPNFHNAVMHAEDPELGENIVAEEFQKGYMYKDTVVRHSMVKVVN
ncbi:MAG: GrpE protein [Anaerocolumna sp.]|nr:GrpE protein [Anaerocolumna sp.]